MQYDEIYALRKEMLSQNISLYLLEQSQKHMKFGTWRLDAR